MFFFWLSKVNAFAMYQIQYKNTYEGWNGVPGTPHDKGR